MGSVVVGSLGSDLAQGRDIANFLKLSDAKGAYSGSGPTNNLPEFIISKAAKARSHST
jgi:hypothetical protein